jgi:hypothetical protein
MKRVLIVEEASGSRRHGRGSTWRRCLACSRVDEFDDAEDGQL